MKGNTSTAEIGSGGSESQTEGNPEGDESMPSGGYDFQSFLSETADQKIDPANVRYNDQGRRTEEGDLIEDDSDDAGNNQPEDEENAGELIIESKSSGKQRTLQEIQQYRHEQNKARKLEGLDEEEAKLFKQMSQAAYDRLYPAYLKSKEADARLKELEETNKALENRRWYEEENAWELSPEFRATKENIDLLDFEENYWTEQLARIEKGEDFEPLAGKPGEYTRGAAQPATVEAKVNVLRKLQTIGGYKQQLNSKIESLKTDFSGRHKSFQDGLKGVDQHLFGKLDVKLPHLESQYKSWLNRFPKEFQGQLPYQMLAKAALVIDNLAKELRKTEATSPLKKSVRNATLSVGPGNGKAVGSGEGNSLKAVESRFEQLTGKKLSS